MASEIDICNLALAHLGDDATVASIDPPEGSAQAEHCARFYPIARDALLEIHDWKFATRRAALAQLVDDAFNWTYAYAPPSGALKLISVLPATASPDDEGQPFDTENQADGTPMILTDLESATLRYTARVTDTTKFSPLFVDALARLLASYLAGPILKGDVGKAEAKAQYAAFRAVLSQAEVSDANQRHGTPEHKPEWMAGR